MKQYLQLLEEVLFTGVLSEDRTGTGTYSLFGKSYKHKLSMGFPLLTTKHVSFKNIKSELLWFLLGDTNVHWLHEQGNHIWDEWADENGEVGPIYSQMVYWEPGGFNQLVSIIREIRVNPSSRRLFLSNWNPATLPTMKNPRENPSIGKGALAPCHVSYQFRVNQETKELDLCMYQRSADIFLGVPYNLASCALLLSMVAHVTGYKTGWFIHMFGDVHLYKNHVEQAKEQLKRDTFRLPILSLDKQVKEINHFTMENIKLLGYESGPAIKAPISI